MISLRAGRLSRRGAVILASTATGIALVGGGVAWAYWNANTSVPTYAVADSVGAGGAPTATVSGTSINLTWSASTTAGGRAVGGYLVNRYPSASGGTATPAAQGTCAATPVAALTCTEANVPPGTWYYTITPVLSAWHGTESPRGNGVSAADTFTLSGATTLTAGTASTLTITAKAGSQTDPGYTGPRTLTFSGPNNAPNGTVPAYNNGNPSVTFTNGVATVPITLYKAESTTLSVANGPVTGSLALTVNPATASQFGVSVPASPTAGVQQTVTLTTLDAYQNKATSYTGNHNLTWSGPGNAPNGQAPSYPSSATFTGGSATATVTLYRAESTTLTTSDSAIAGTSPSFTVSAAAASQFNVPTPATQTAGTPFVLTITAQDPYQNKATSYTSNHNLSWTGPGNAPNGQAPSYPTSVTFTAGTATPTITLVKAETPTLKVAEGTITASTTFTVNPGAATNLAWTGAAATKATISSPCLFTCTVTSLNNNAFTANVSVTDAEGNIINNLGSSITVTISTTAGGTVTPATLTIPATGAATSTGQVTFKGQTGGGGWSSATMTASGPYASATANLSK